MLIVGLVDYLVYPVFQLLAKHFSVCILCTVLDDENYRLLLGGYKSLGYFYDRFQNMRMTALVPTNLVHPHVYDHNVCHCQAEQRDLLLYDFLFSLTLNRVESLSVNDIQVIHVLKPYPFRAAFSVLFCVKD